MNEITVLSNLYDASQGIELALPGELSRIYGSLRFPIQAGKPYVLSNYVQSLDGVVTLDVPGHESGGDISGYNAHDRIVMGLLRAAADVVLISAGSLRVNPKSTWTAGAIYPDLRSSYITLRNQLNKPSEPPHVVVTASGKLDLSLPLFNTPEISVLVVTTRAGEKVLSPQNSSRKIKIIGLKSEGYLRSTEIIEAVKNEYDPSLVLTEAGPHLTSYFIEDNCLDELFLTVAPQVAGRDGLLDRWAFTHGKVFAPDNPRWGDLISIKQGGSHLFLRYSFHT